MKIAVKNDEWRLKGFDGDEFIIDLSRRMDEYQAGDLICYGSPWAFSGFNIKLEIAIALDGTVKFRSWSFFSGEGNAYFHTLEKARHEDCCRWEKPFVPTQAQIDTVNGLWSGRILFDGQLKLGIGGSLREISPIDVGREEQLTGKKSILHNFFFLRNKRF